MPETKITAISNGRNLAVASAKVELPTSEAVAWHRELNTARKILKVPIDKWR
ncbi:MAG: hypothetical protein WCD79_16220 [Chthoniobacteraceae bacterium]